MFQPLSVAADSGSTARAKRYHDLAKYLRHTDLESLRGIWQTVRLELSRFPDGDDMHTKVALLDICKTLSLAMGDVEEYVPSLTTQLDMQSPTPILAAALESLLLTIKAKNAAAWSQDSMDTLIHKLIWLLASPAPTVRSLCVSLLASITKLPSSRSVIGTMSLEKLDPATVQDICAEFMGDEAVVVRASALKALITLAESGLIITKERYLKVAHLASDESKTVRMSAIHLMWILVNSHPHAGIPGNDAVKMANHAFLKLSDMMVSDAVPEIRARACGLLGTFRQINENFLLQTLNKEMMSNLQSLKRKRGGKGDSGKSKKGSNRLAISEPQLELKIEMDEANLLESSACGAFIHGLEDEFEEVRSVCVDSICELSIWSEHFALRALDYLVDMFNDEMQKVRLNSIHSLRKIAQRHAITLNSNQLQSVSLALQDASRIVREAAHKMLSSLKFNHVKQLLALRTSLEQNLARFPRDRPSIYQCLSELGRNNPECTEALISVFLRIDDRFLPQEIAMEDPQHIGNIIMIFSAAAVRASILSTLPKYTFSHLAFVRQKFPDFVPSLEIQTEEQLEAYPLTPEPERTDQVSSRIQSFDGSTSELLKSAVAYLNRGGRYLDVGTRILQNCKERLEYSIHVSCSNTHHGKASYLLRMITCIGIVARAKKFVQEKSAQMPSVAGTLASQLLVETYKLRHGFLGVSKSVAARYSQSMRYFSYLLWAIHNNCRSGVLKTIKTEFESVERESIQDPSFVHDVGDFIDAPEAAVNNMELAAELIEHFRLHYEEASAIVREAKVKAEIVTKTPDAVEAIVAGFPYHLKLQASLSWVERCERVIVKVLFPDGFHILHRPPPTDLRMANRTSYALATRIALSFPVPTTEQFVVKVMALYEHPLDSPADIDILKFGKIGADTYHGVQLSVMNHTVLFVTD
ncbi:armadillo-type protein [Polychytrium aggregatum]|uniref:armadillo-type protein n=1 Tax=Polychytrium aggregatum TaxID=110093 RepID=UPI0022FECC0A|nr:armadillo-type protein [Polychytrium aggregatum]KAI9209747.1 armadillo-type protein [Polychytrium aggregatum]